MRRTIDDITAAGILRAVGLGAAALLAGAGAGRAAERADVPVHQTVLPDGDPRYSVPVTVGNGPPIEAALDTGSFGLRVLASALSPGQYEATDIHRRYPFGGGARFDGILARATLGVGPVRTDAPVLFQRIDRVDCVEEKPDCPASKVSAADYLIAGDGYPGQGFPAILGLSLRRAPGGVDGAPNPLSLAGDRSWILVLPRPGSAEPGHLIIDPDDRDRAGFTLLKLDPQPGTAGDEPPGWADAALPGCLVGRGKDERYCGRTLLDTGAPGLSVASPAARGPKPWGAGRSASFEIGGTGGPVAIPFTSGQGPATRVTLHPPRGQGPAISAGTLPYLSYEVLYDARAGTIGFKPRDPAEP
ncbi:hypothetical protein D3273_08890 [Lichenibacterium minor]|uniref:Peptidase A2 domain-containing protein n=1 Tax=Lichenibacterium minor TaxID=2316528 RepID=A0A4Q2UCB6_9HYPH|nr:hypothetical protein [Lichenibacterium minor]RYC32495.1 hypothetical protein D3273_08890 [Lichenibacterium minor]